MKINEFINAAKENTTSIADLIAAKKYIPSTEKMHIAEQVADMSAEYERGFVKFNSYKKHLAFVFAVIEAHTNLRFADNWDDKMQEYDALCENELLDDVINTFIKDYYEALMVLNMRCDDMLAENSIEASVVKLTQGVVENLDVFVGSLSDKIEDLDIEKIIPKDLDLNKLIGLLNKIK